MISNQFWSPNLFPNADRILVNTEQTSLVLMDFEDHQIFTRFSMRSCMSVSSLHNFISRRLSVSVNVFTSTGAKMLSKPSRISTFVSDWGIIECWKKNERIIWKHNYKIKHETKIINNAHIHAFVWSLEFEGSSLNNWFAHNVNFYKKFGMNHNNVL